MPMLDGPDCALWYEPVGDGAPVSIWVHGLTSSIDELRPLAAHAGGTRVLMDVRGHGASESPPASAGYGPAAIRADLEAVAEATGATRAFGISSGANAILNLLADDPDRFERVALFLPSAIDEPAPANGAHSSLASQLEQVSLATLAEQHASADSSLYDARPYWRELVRARTLRMNATGVPRALRAYATAGAPVADAGLLARVRAPVLLLAHENDPVHDAAHARRLATIFANARLEVWPEMLAMYDDVDAFARLIGDFMRA